VARRQTDIDGWRNSHAAPLRFTTTKLDIELHHQAELRHLLVNLAHTRSCHRLVPSLCASVRRASSRQRGMCCARPSALSPSASHDRRHLSSLPPPAARVGSAARDVHAHDRAHHVALVASHVWPPRALRRYPLALLHDDDGDEVLPSTLWRAQSVPKPQQGHASSPRDLPLVIGGGEPHDNATHTPHAATHTPPPTRPTITPPGLAPGSREGNHCLPRTSSRLVLLSSSFGASGSCT
jgi:hypothetical protein